MPSDSMTEAVIRAFEEDPSLIGRLLGIDLPGNVTVTRLEEYIPDPKTIERDLPTFMRRSLKASAGAWLGR